MALQIQVVAQVMLYQHTRRQRVLAAYVTNMTYLQVQLEVTAVQPVQVIHGALLLETVNTGLIGDMIMVKTMITAIGSLHPTVLLSTEFTQQEHMTGKSQIQPETE
jgi:hypothetical protein